VQSECVGVAPARYRQPKTPRRPKAAAPAASDDLCEAAVAADAKPVVEAAGSTAGKAAAPAAPRLDVSRILTPKDFERIRRLKQLQTERQNLRGAKRKRAETLALEEEEEELRGKALEEEAVNAMDIEGVQAKRNASREEKLASTLAGREDRQKFGTRSKKKTGGSSDKEKRKTKAMMMMRRNHGIRSKARRRDENARMAQRRNKKMFRGKVRK